MQLTLLGIVLVIGRLLNRYKIMWIGEAGAAVLLGLLVGLILHVSDAPKRFTEKLVFKASGYACGQPSPARPIQGRHTVQTPCLRVQPTSSRTYRFQIVSLPCFACAIVCVCHCLRVQPDIFLYIFLPTIMFDAGYSLDARP